MATTVGTETDPIKLLNGLIQLDFDAIGAYQAAINRLDDDAHKNQLAAFKGDHERHTRELTAVVRDHGHEPATGPDLKELLTVGKVAFADFVGAKAVLQAMKTNEDDTNGAYERAAARDDLPAAAVPLIRAALADERKHRDWIEKTIAAL